MHFGMPYSRGSRLYAAAVAAAGSALLARLLWVDRGSLLDLGSGGSLGELQMFGFLTLFAIIASLGPIVTTSGVTLSASLAPLFAAVLTLHPGMAGLVGVFGTIDTRRPGRDIPWFRFFFNRGMYAIVYGLGGLVFFALRNSASSTDKLAGTFNLVAAGSIALVVVAAINIPAVIVFVSMWNREPIRTVTYRSLRGVLLSYAGLAPIGALIAYLVVPKRAQGLLVAGLILLLLLVYRELSRRSFKLETVARGSYVAQSRLIDKKDRSTFGHSERVGLLSEAIANKMRLPADHVEQIKIGATLHDLGKIAIPDAILHKPGRLSAEEWEIMKTHAQEGYEVLHEQEVLERAAEIVLTHHENYDGSGYPSQMAGKQIPIGGRITRVVDSYDCMTNVRDYREWVKKPVDAVGEINFMSGSTYDPSVVQAFTAVLVEQHPDIAVGLTPELRQSSTSLGDALRFAPFFKIWAAHGLSIFGDMFTVTALALAVFLSTNSVFALAAMFAARGVPHLLFGLTAGALIDRYDRKFVMVLMDVIRALLVISLPFLISAPLPLLLLIAFLTSTAGVFFNPARAAALPDIVPADLLQSSNAALALIERIAEVGGYFAAAAILPLGGLQLAFAIDALTFVGSAGFVLATQFPEYIAAKVHGIRLAGLVEEVIAGLARMRSSSVLRAALPLSFVMSAGMSALLPLMVPLALNQLRAGPSGFPILEAAIAIGVAGGAVIVGYLHTIRRGPLIIFGGLGMGLTTVAAGISTDLRLTFILFVIGGLANAFYQVPLITLVQEAAGSEVRGRVVAARYSLVQIGSLVGIGYAAIASSINGSTVGLLVVSAGVIMFVVSSGAAVSASLRRA